MKQVMMKKIRVWALAALAAVACVGGAWAADEYVDVSTWVKLKEVIQAGGKAKLTASFNQTGKTTTELDTCNIDNVTSVLDLNGYTITGDQAERFLFRARNGGDFTIEDSSEAKTGCLTTTKNGTMSDHGYCLVVQGGSTVTLVGGTVSNWRKTAGAKCGAGVYVTGGSTFILDGGTIANCECHRSTESSNRSYGGGIYCGSGTVLLKSGTIDGCKADHGAGVAIRCKGTTGTVGVSPNVTIKSCTADGTSGALFVEYLDNGTTYATISGGRFIDNQCGYNSSTAFAGAIGLYAVTKATVTGGYFEGNNSVNGKTATPVDIVWTGSKNAAPAAVSKFYGGVFKTEPKTSNQKTSSVAAWNVLADGYEKKQVGDFWVIGKSDTMTVSAENQLTAGTFTFDPLVYNDATGLINASQCRTYKDGDNELWSILRIKQKQVTDDDDKEVVVSVPENWMKKQGVENNNLDDPGANGLPVWQSYVLGLEPTNAMSKIVLTPVQTSNPEKLTLTLGNNFAPKTDAGATVTYQLGTKDGDDTEFTYGDEQTSYQFEVPLPESGVEYFRIKATLRGNDK